MRKPIACALLAILVFALLTGCQAPQEKKDYTVAFVPKLTGNAFFEAANVGAQNYATQQGFTVRYEGSPVASVEEQIAIVEALVAEKAVDAICISSLDKTALDDALRKAVAAGIQVVTWDSDVSGDVRSLMVSQGTPEQLGKMLIEMAAKSLEERGKNTATDTIYYAWHYSQAGVADQNSWYQAGEDYIKQAYPNWVNAAPECYYSQQDAAKALEVGLRVLDEHPQMDLILCPDSTALPGQAQALEQRGLSAQDLTVTGFASPSVMREYCKAGIITRWGLWDCGSQGALGCYLANYLAQGNKVKVGDKIDVPKIGIVEIMPNTVLDPGAYAASNSGTVLLPERVEFTIKNVDQYDF